MSKHHEQDDVTIRETPTARWPAIGWLTLALVVAAMSAWEWKMRSLGLFAGDIDDSKSHWAVERRKIAAGEYDDVVIVGTSRILFDTDLDVWEELTGRRPIQLALPGTNPRPLLDDLAADPSFKGRLVLVDTTPDLFFGDWPGIPEFAGVTDYWKEESPSSRFGHRVGLFLSRHLAFIDSAYTLTKLVERVDLPNREGMRTPYLDVWKVWESFDDRQTFLWRRIETDERLREHARFVWGPFNGEPMDPAAIGRAWEQAAAAVAKIRARGGEVAFIRPPSGGLYYEHEQHAAPRAKTWDPLLVKTRAFGIHFKDYPQMQGLETPEWSHLSRASAERFTRAYVEVLMKQYPWLAARAPGGANQAE